MNLWSMFPSNLGLIEPISNDKHHRYYVVGVKWRHAKAQPGSITQDFFWPPEIVQTFWFNKGENNVCNVHLLCFSGPNTQTQSQKNRRSDVQGTTYRMATDPCCWFLFRANCLNQGNTMPPQPDVILVFTGISDSAMWVIGTRWSFTFDVNRVLTVSLQTQCSVRLWRVDAHPCGPPYRGLDMFVNMYQHRV